MFIFGNLPDPRGLGCARTLRYAWLYPRQSQASLEGYYGANTRTSQKIANVFSKNFRLVSKLLVHLEKTDARHKQLRYGAGRVVGPPTPLGYGTPHHPTPTLLMNAKFLAEVYLSCVREHGSRVKKTKARIHKNSMGHTVDFNENKFLYS